MASPEGAGRLLPAGPGAVLLELPAPARPCTPAPDGAGVADPVAGLVTDPVPDPVPDPVADPVADALRVAELAAAIRVRVGRGELVAVDVVPGARTVLVDGVRPGDLDLLRDLLDTAVAARAAAGSRDDPPLELPTVYDGADLAAVAELWGVDAGTVVARHAEVDFRVAFCGFAPGFAYLAGLPAAWSVPRRGQPRPRVPAGSVGLAGWWCGVYPASSPGGWQLLGHTDVGLFDPAAAEPAVLAPGRRVRFVPVSR